ncbi:glycosyltransferase family 61 protein [Brachybacterium sp. J153]|uniref:glycosyltransferase family 61 protein n=1 Tax=Brachybacterium sp. J153 TaxID=3116488 RepID=UPI002E799E4C|nr:glycosyltransferase 61 family protein [Brachybacterium sp. J153]MEE1617828.1 glycosyltransferase 61 family protein [Brachybacterium sp. J153]
MIYDDLDEVLELVVDPRRGGPDFRVLAKWEMRHEVRNDARFWDDPFDVGFKRPRPIESVPMEGFYITLGENWKTDGHRILLNSQDGMFLLDKVFSDNALRWANFIKTDRDTSLYAGPGTVGLRRAGEAKPAVHISGTVGAALGTEPSNWGSFVARILPRAIMFKKLGIPKLLVYCRHTRQKELLHLVGWDAADIIEFEPWRSYSADCFHLISELANGLHLSPFAVSDLRGLGANCVDGGTPRRIFVSRNGGIASKSARYCINGADVEAAVTSLGFEVVVPDSLSVSKQLALFAGAETIIGPSGAGMFNSVFSGPSTKVLDIESQSDWIHGHNNLFSSAGLEYGFQIARACRDADAAHRPFEVNVPTLVNRIQESM